MLFLAKRILTQIKDIEDIDIKIKNEIFENAASFSRKVSIVTSRVTSKLYLHKL